MISEPSVTRVEPYGPEPEIYISKGGEPSVIGAAPQLAGLTKYSAKGISDIRRFFIIELVLRFNVILV